MQTCLLQFTDAIMTLIKALLKIIQFNLVSEKRKLMVTAKVGNQLD